MPSRPSGPQTATGVARAAVGAPTAPQAVAATRAVAALAKSGERSAAAPGKPAAPILRQTPAEDAFAAQLQRGIAAALNGSGGTVTMRLSPEVLGSLQVRLDLHGSTVAARFRVESDEARKLLDQHMPALRSALEARGLVVDRVVVDLLHQPNTDPQQQPAPLATPTGSTNPDGRREKREEPSRRSPQAVAAASMTPTLGSRSDPFTPPGGALQIRLDAIA